MNDQLEEPYDPYLPHWTSNDRARSRGGARHGGVHVVEDDNIDGGELQRRVTHAGPVTGEVADATAKTETAMDDMIVGDTVEAIPYAAQFDLEDVTTSDEAASGEEEDVVGHLLREWTTLEMDHNHNVKIPITATD